MFRAEILWLANGPTLKMEGRLAGQWVEEARRLITVDIVPKGLIIDLTDVSYVDSAGERLLSWLSSVGAMFVANVYTTEVCERLGLSPYTDGPRAGMRVTRRSPFMHPVHVDASPRQKQKEEQ